MNPFNMPLSPFAMFQQQQMRVGPYQTPNGQFLGGGPATLPIGGGSQQEISRALEAQYQSDMASGGLGDGQNPYADPNRLGGGGIVPNPFGQTQYPPTPMPELPQAPSYNPDEPMKAPFGIKMTRGQADYLKDLSAGIGQATDNPFLQAMGYAQQKKDARGAYDAERAQKGFENQIKLRELGNSEKSANAPKWQIGSMYDDAGREQKIIYDERDPMNYRPLGGSKQKDIGTPVKIIGANGQPVYSTAEDAIGKTPYEKPDRPQPGFSVRTNPDGSTEFVYGESAGLTNTNQTKVQGDILGAQDGIARLDAISRGFKPEYQQIGTRIGAAMTAGREKIGMKIDPKDQQALNEFTQYKRAATENLNLRIKELTGSAMGVQEAERIVSSLPNPGSGLTDGDSPTEFKAKLDGTIKALKQVEARRIYTMQKGIQPNAIPLESMPAVIDKRGDEIEAEIKKRNPTASPDQINQTVRDQLKREFGL